jgi:hypothetical protein
VNNVTLTDYTRDFPNSITPILDACPSDIKMEFDTLRGLLLFTKNSWRLGKKGGNKRRIKRVMLGIRVPKIEKSRQILDNISPKVSTLDSRDVALLGMNTLTVFVVVILRVTQKNKNQINQINQRKQWHGCRISTINVQGVTCCIFSKRYTLNPCPKRNKEL